MSIRLRILIVTILSLGSAVPRHVHARPGVLDTLLRDAGLAEPAEVPAGRLAQRSTPDPGGTPPATPGSPPAITTRPASSFRATLPPTAQAALTRLRAQSVRVQAIRAPSPIVLKILQPAPDKPNEVDAIGMNWKQPYSVRFSWRTAQGAAGALYQVALFPFPTSPEQWAVPPGAVTCGPPGIAGGQAIPPGGGAVFDLDLRVFAPLPGMKPTYSKPSAGQGGLVPRIPGRPPTPPPIQKPGPAPGSMLIPGDFAAPRLLALPVANTLTTQVVPGQGCAFLTQDAQKVRNNLVTHNPLVYFVRVVTLNARGEPSAPPSAGVTVTYYMEEPPKPIKILPSPLTVQAKYVPVRWARSGYQFHYVCTQLLAPFCLQAGQKLEFHPSSGCSGLDCVGEAIGDAADSFTSWVEGAVDWVAEAYGSIKEAALNLAMKLIPGNCDPCRTALKLGLDYGLTCLGMPPELPNFDQLVALGQGYLVDQLTEVASQQAGVPIPREAAERLVDEVSKRAKQVEARGPDGTQWFRPDPDYQYNEPYIVVHVTNPSAYSRKARLWIVQNGLYWGKDITLPALAPHAEMTVPVVLRRRADAQVDKLGRAVGNPGTVDNAGGHAWLAEYYGGQATLEVRITDVGVPDLPTVQVAVPMPGCPQLKEMNKAEPC